jgi:NADPH:quinone reductase-like Zn-dependent oxidoreductase
MGPFRPRYHILGSDIAGQVEAAGRNTTLFQPGQDVFADIRLQDRLANPARTPVRSG